jgi:hypothetical protein
MTPEAILADLIQCGIEPSVTPDKTGIVVPAGKLTEAQRAAVLGHKKELIAYLVESSRITARLLEAAMRRCDQFNDSDKARQDMREQILETPPHLRQDLLDHFLGKPT